jgi:transcriptional regulator with XRE-family HTH domain
MMGAERVSVISDRFANELDVSEDVRSAFVSAQLSTFVSYQIRTLRIQNQLSQEELATLLGTSQSTVARLENIDYGKYSVQTLVKLAKVFDVALVVEFAEFPDFLLRTRNMSEQAMTRRRFSRKSLDFLCSNSSPILTLVSGNEDGYVRFPQITPDGSFQNDASVEPLLVAV